MKHDPTNTPCAYVNKQTVLTVIRHLDMIVKTVNTVTPVHSLGLSLLCGLQDTLHTFPHISLYDGLWTSTQAFIQP